MTLMRGMTVEGPGTLTAFNNIRRTTGEAGTSNIENGDGGDGGTGLPGVSGSLTVNGGTVNINGGDGSDGGEDANSGNSGESGDKGIALSGTVTCTADNYVFQESSNKTTWSNLASGSTSAHA